MSYHQRRSYGQESYSYGPPKMSHPKFRHKVPYGNVSWQPLPAWEKRFCVEVGGIPWKRFVKAKKNLYKTDKVYDWNDSAGLMAFNEAKQRFWAEFHGFPCKIGLPSADMYIDRNPKIDRNTKIDPVFSAEIKAPSDDEKEAVVNRIDWISIPLDQIKPTGWDDLDYGPQLPKFVGTMEHTPN